MPETPVQQGGYLRSRQITPIPPLSHQYRTTHGFTLLSICYTTQYADLPKVQDNVYRGQWGEPTGYCSPNKPTRHKREMHGKGEEAVGPLGQTPAYYTGADINRGGYSPPYNPPSFLSSGWPVDKPRSPPPYTHCGYTHTPPRPVPRIKKNHHLTF